MLNTGDSDAKLSGAPAKVAAPVLGPATGSDAGIGSGRSVGEDATVSKSYRQNSHMRKVKSISSEEQCPSISECATYIHMHAWEPACVLPRRRGLAELTEVIV